MNEDEGMRRLLFATNAKHRALTADDLQTVAAFAAHEYTVEPLVWNDLAQTARIAGAAGVVLRSCWDYHLQPDAFREWIDRLERQGVPLINPGPLLRWNLHKGYLLDLAARGAAVVPTRLLTARSDISLASVLRDAGWDEAVVKPAVSLSAHDTWRTSASSATNDEGRWQRLVSAGDMLVQPFVPEVITDGEWSLVFLGGRFTHAVLKQPASGDFRVQTDHGGRVERVDPPEELRHQAAALLALLPEPAVYARLDGVRIEGRFVLMEAECIDPVLHFERHASSAAAFADAVARALGTIVSATSSP